MAEKKTESKPKNASNNTKKTTSNATKKATNTTIKTATTKKITSTSKPKTATTKKTNVSTNNASSKVKSSAIKKATSSKTTKSTAKKITSDKIVIEEKKSSTKASTQPKNTSKKENQPLKGIQVEKRKLTLKEKELKTMPKEKGKLSKKKTSSPIKQKNSIVKKKPIKKIVSTKKEKGNRIPTNKQENWNYASKEVIKKLNKKLKHFGSFMSQKIKMCGKKVNSIFQNTRTKIIFKIKEISKISSDYLKKGSQKLKDYLYSQKKNKGNLEKKPKNIKKGKGVSKENETKVKFSLTKKTRRFLIIMAISCILLAVLLIIPYGVATYKSGASNRVLEIPKFMKLKEECCNYTAIFSSPRSAWALKKDLEKIIKSYELLNCDGKNYYYNAKENYTITEYGVEKGIFLNRVYFTYGIGNSCNMDTKFKKLELLDDDFSLEDAKRDGNYTIENEKVYNKKAYDDFMNNVKLKVPSTLRIVTSTKEGDVLITDLEYLSSGKYMVYYDGTRDRNAKNHRSIIAYKFDHLKINKNKLYAYNGEKLIIKNAKKYETYYLLTLPKE